jgi:hypothetical protein
MIIQRVMGIIILMMVMALTKMTMGIQAIMAKQRAKQRDKTRIKVR